MLCMHIKKTALMVAKKYKTTCPFQISDYKNIPVLIEPLGSVYGYTHTYKRTPIIHINSELDEPMQRFVCAHELGHAVLHPNANTPFLRANTLFSIDRIEREANKFAVELLMPDELLREYQTIYEAAKACSVPIELARLKMSQY